MTEAVLDLNRADPDALKLQRPLHDGKLVVARSGGLLEPNRKASAISVPKANPGPAGQKRFRDPAQLWFRIGGLVGKTGDDRRRVRGRHSIR
jgi:hypothetical protein